MTIKEIEKLINEFEQRIIEKEMVITTLQEEIKDIKESIASAKQALTEIEKLTKEPVDTIVEISEPPQLQEKVSESNDVEAGFYNENGELLASWDEVIFFCGADITKHYNTFDDCKEDKHSLYRVLSDYRHLYGCTKIVISDTTEIGDYVFADQREIKDISIPDGIQSIGALAFLRCIGLTTIAIPDSVKHIGVAAFSNCRNLQDIIISNNITRIEPLTFELCKSLERIFLPNGVTSIGYRAFWACSNLTHISIPNSVQNIENGAFSSCRNLERVNIGNGVTCIEPKAFEGCDCLQSVHFMSTDGWWYLSRDRDSTDGKPIDVEDSYLMARFLRGRYSNCYWRRKDCPDIFI